jgi:hypothetical protein
MKRRPPFYARFERLQNSRIPLHTLCAYGIAFLLTLPFPLSAAIKSAPTPVPTGSTPGSAPDGAPSAPQLEDIAPPLDVFPYPPWMIGFGILLLLIFVFFGIRWWTSRRPTAPPPTPPRVLALSALEKLGLQMETLSPYAFSIAVSDIVRQFVEADTGVHAVRQTSVEFLASISTRLSVSDRDLLTGFLEHCDLIKFAQATATTTDSRTLLASAEAFIQGRIQ